MFWLLIILITPWIILSTISALLCVYLLIQRETLAAIMLLLLSFFFALYAIFAILAVDWLSNSTG